MNRIKYIFFDVANTLLYKPDLFQKIHTVLNTHSFEVDIEEIELRHKILSEVIKFPDKTSKEFYEYFNKELLYSLGIIPSEKLVFEVYNNCSYLNWQPFGDTGILSQIPIPIGIISNWDQTLTTKLQQFFAIDFFRIIASKEIGISKPDKRIFHAAFDSLNCAPEEMLYIGDSIKLDIEPTLEMGIQALLIDRSSLFASCPSRYRINSLNDILERFEFST